MADAALEQRDYCHRLDRDLDRRRHARLRAVEARLAPDLGLALSIARDARNRDRHLAVSFQWAFRWLGWHLGLYTVILAHVSFSIAYVAIVVARLQTFDPALEEAAMDLGTEWRAFWRVTLPALTPGIVAAGLLALTISFDDYVITSLVAGVDSTTLPMVIYAMARRGANPSINAISALIVVIFGAIILISDGLREA